MATPSAISYLHPLVQCNAHLQPEHYGTCPGVAYQTSALSVPDLTSLNALLATQPQIPGLSLPSPLPPPRNGQSSSGSTGSKGQSGKTCNKCSKSSKNKNQLFPTDRLSYSPFQLGALATNGHQLYYSSSCNIADLNKPRLADYLLRTESPTSSSNSSATHSNTTESQNSQVSGDDSDARAGHESRTKSKSSANNRRESKASNFSSKSAFEIESQASQVSMNEVKKRSELPLLEPLLNVLPKLQLQQPSDQSTLDSPASIDAVSLPSLTQVIIEPTNDQPSTTTSQHTSMAAARPRVDASVRRSLLKSILRKAAEEQATEAEVSVIEGELAKTIAKAEIGDLKRASFAKIEQTNLTATNRLAPVASDKTDINHDDHRLDTTNNEAATVEQQETRIQVEPEAIKAIEHSANVETNKKKWNVLSGKDSQTTIESSSAVNVMQPSSNYIPGTTVDSSITTTTTATTTKTSDLPTTAAATIIKSSFFKKKVCFCIQRLPFF